MDTPQVLEPFHAIRRPNARRQTAVVWLVAAVSGMPFLAADARTQGSPETRPEPYTIRAADQSGSVVGLIYSAETLSAFAASETTPVSHRVAELSVRERQSS